MSATLLSRRHWLLAAWAALAGSAAARPQRPAAAATPATPAVKARYRATLSRRGQAPRVQTWTLLRDAERVAMRKDGIDEVWLRDGAGRLSFERRLHRLQRVADYSAGELAALGVAVDWPTLSRLADAAEIARLGPAWNATLQLPWRLQRRAGRERVLQLQLLGHAALQPEDWTALDADSAGYLHLDAADFGDLPHEAAVRLSEALDARSGWRAPHGHD